MKKLFFLTAIAMALISPSFAQEKTNDMNVNGRATIYRAWEKNDAVQPAVLKEVKEAPIPISAALTAAPGGTITQAGNFKWDGTKVTIKNSTAHRSHRRYWHSVKKQRSTHIIYGSTSGNPSWINITGSGTVSDFVGDAKPLFTTSVSSQTTTPALTFTLTRDVTGEKPKPIKKE